MSEKMVTTRIGGTDERPKYSITFVDGVSDWAELSIQAIKLQKKRDHLLNLEKYDLALKAHMDMEMVNFEMTKWIASNSK